MLTSNIPSHKSHINFYSRKCWANCNGFWPLCQWRTAGRRRKYTIVLIIVVSIKNKLYVDRHKVDIDLIYDINN